MSLVKSLVGYISNEDIFVQTTTAVTIDPRQSEEIFMKLFEITLTTAGTRTSRNETRTETGTFSPSTKIDIGIYDSIVENLAVENMSLKTIIYLLTSLLFCAGACKLEINIFLQLCHKVNTLVPCTTLTTLYETVKRCNVT